MKKNIFFIFLFGFALFAGSCNEKSPIDRFSLVSRHNIENRVIDSLNSLSVGNGDFAFTVDITGLQTFPEFYSKGIPLGTMSNWGWHTGENPENYQISDNYKEYDVNGRNVEYVSQYRKGEDQRKVAASDWLRGNPQRIHLGLVGLNILKADGT
jgi:protein-glucosylgalactosylhydroxylysine glucosidase